MKKKPRKLALIKILRNGPYEVIGPVPLKKQVVVSGRDGIPVKWKDGPALSPEEEPYHLCRCGHTAGKPYCDGTHASIRFNGTETAGRETHTRQAETTSGPALDLKDAVKFCSVSLFCHRDGDAWTLAEKSGNKKAARTARQEAADCPSGRLVAVKKDGTALEPGFEPGISLVEDPYRKASGPLWVKGGIPVESSKGFKYEVRNRVTLCRCGRSVNKPFCDGSHLPFKDGDKRVA